ncbi:MAG: hypothetical protein A2900_01355 [Candidatus Chisholmbacteria bacterium RIFCSPLOWO2_01_FULL_50_28]|uniref:Cell envelope-related transcriptional attenuator domain-containing protein n=1 Tax=Candidatus Chisholmbacteria bacterium RIFCSPHIGHO2_01_FULL_52_32 TaxID=1797591 RepID=A0A1G1VTZ0_9BACT|nr:MAG: hypothetical protein A2786_05385 [Candidatus Chisholmbacteria bacterium RIFCSPHIGHO2_01_FULL_52_32]OGY19736.1 MAG: hypothetical protein A2900_01355 [Candidatus Chisholmbacteria bacterium RIFCSPLOWO2_01_FULL_50_28]
MDYHFLAKIKRRLTKHRSVVRAVLLVTIGAIAVISIVQAVRPLLTVARSLLRGPQAAFSLVRDPQAVLQTTKGRTNILLLGMGGANHEGPELTDSIIVLSIDLKSADTALLSIPRDIWIDSLKTKINATYFFGEQKRQGGGLILAKSAAEEVIGEPIHYAVAIDFDGFKTAIDLVGGIEIDVPRSFDDYKYPIPGMEEAEPEDLRYEHLHFDKGLQELSGERALKYVRSRNAEGEEGTDFARSRRQREVLIAFKNKILSLDTLLSPTKVRQLMQTFSGTVKTDLSETEYVSLAKLALKTQAEHIRHGVIEEEDKEAGKPGLLIHPPLANYNGQWVLIGRNGWEEIHTYIERFFYQAR